MQETLAVMVTGGKQCLVRLGDVIRVEKLSGVAGTTLMFPEVLLLVEGDAISVGQPVVAGASVTATILRQGRADKVVGVKFKPKKRQKKSFGHRQAYTEIKIERIERSRD